MNWLPPNSPIKCPLDNQRVFPKVVDLLGLLAAFFTLPEHYLCMVIPFE